MANKNDDSKPKMTSTKVCRDLVHNENDLIAFAKAFEVRNEQHAITISLMKRRKYCPSLPEGNKMTRLEVISGGKDFVHRFVKKVKLLQTEADDVPDSAFVIYALIHPKDTLLAMSKVIGRCIADLSNPNSRIDPYFAYHNEILMCEACGKDVPKLIQIDLDTKEYHQVIQVEGFLRELKVPILMCIETKGGFHLVYVNKNASAFGRQLHEFKLTTAFKKPNVNGETVTDYWFSTSRWPNVVVPGTVQGGFKARIVDLDVWLAENKARVDAEQYVAYFGEETFAEL